MTLRKFQHQIIFKHIYCKKLANFNKRQCFFSGKNCPYILKTEIEVGLKPVRRLYSKNFTLFNAWIHTKATKTFSVLPST